MTVPNQGLRVPQEIVDQFEIASAYDSMVEKCVNIPFWGFKKAVKCQRLQQKHNDIAWRMVVELYPVLANHALRYQPTTQTVRIQDKEAAAEKTGPSTSAQQAAAQKLPEQNTIEPATSGEPVGEK